MTFEYDLARGDRYRPLYERFFDFISYKNRYVFVDHSPGSVVVQRRLKADVIVQVGSEHKSVLVEIKTDFWPENNQPRPNFFLETDSCTVLGRESKGWMRDSQADYL